jgi:high-affinity iron transporter
MPNRLFGLLFAVILAFMPASAFAQGQGAQVAWRLLDYMAVDYAGAVGPDGHVVSAAEYAEMVEFSASVTQRIAALPARPERAGLIAEAQAVQAAVARKAPPAEVQRLAHALGVHLLAAYPVPRAPSATPDPARGAALYAENCASCHGATGGADTPMARQLDPPPVAFADRARARERSIFALYQVIDQGLEGTAMQSFAQLPEQDRWALAIQAGRLAYPDALAAAGRRHWEAEPALRARIPNLEALISITPAALAAEFGEDKASAVIAYLRGHPEALDTLEGAGTLAIARELLAQSLTAYRNGDRDRAGELALAAYLDGFDPV